MKLLFDQNLSPKLADCFRDSFKDTMHLYDLGLDAAEDLIVWKYARSNNFTIVTKDSDLIFYK
jgi:predicted nuclease of predicted toxin-antitoxin system